MLLLLQFYGGNAKTKKLSDLTYKADDESTSSIPGLERVFDTILLPVTAVIDWWEWFTKGDRKPSLASSESQMLSSQSVRERQGIACISPRDIKTIWKYGTTPSLELNDAMISVTIREPHVNNQGFPSTPCSICTALRAETGTCAK